MKGYIVALVCMILFGSVLEILMPDHEFKKYVKPILGMIMVITIIKPLWQSVVLPNDFLKLEDRAAAQNYTQKVYEENVVRTFEEGLSSRIKTVMKTNGVSVKECTVLAQMEKGELAILKVALTADRDEAYVKTVLGRELGILPQSISVTKEG